MSATYTLHVDRRARPGDAAALDRAVLVRDGFSWGAFLVPMLWFFRHGHWVLGIGAALLVGGVAAGLSAAGAGIGTILAVEILLHLLFGLEGASIREVAYRLRGRHPVDVVTADGSADAEHKAFARFLKEPAPEPLFAPAPAMGFGRRETPSVIGLFPDPERSR